jgi:hypothetical protein
MRAISIAKNGRRCVRDDARCTTLGAHAPRPFKRRMEMHTTCSGRALDALSNRPQNTVVIRRLDQRIHGTAVWIITVAPNPPQRRAMDSPVKPGCDDYLE